MTDKHIEKNWNQQSGLLATEAAGQCAYYTKVNKEAELLHTARDYYVQVNKEAELLSISAQGHGAITYR